MIPYDVDRAVRRLIYDAERKLWKQSNQGERYVRRFDGYQFCAEYAEGETKCYQASGSASCTASFGFNIWNVEFTEIAKEEFNV